MQNCWVKYSSARFLGKDKCADLAVAMITIPSFILKIVYPLLKALFSINNYIMPIQKWAPGQYELGYVIAFSNILFFQDKFASRSSSHDEV